MSFVCRFSVSKGKVVWNFCGGDHGFLGVGLGVCGISLCAIAFSGGEEVMFDDEVSIYLPGEDEVRCSRRCSWARKARQDGRVAPREQQFVPFVS